MAPRWSVRQYAYSRPSSGEQVKFDGFINSDEELEEIATEVASGKECGCFPEGESHSSPKTKEIQDNAARIALRARELSVENPPVIIPVGIHYSRKHNFRERVALSIESHYRLKGQLKN